MTTYRAAQWRSECPEREPDLRYQTKSGYWYLRWNAERIEMFEHRYVVDPGPDLQVHHINHDRGDNRIENLEALTNAEHQRRHCDYDWDEVVRLYESGMATTKIAERLGTYSGNVSRILTACGVPRSDLRLALRRPDLDREEIRRRLRAGDPAKRIARDLGCSDWLVRAERQRLGIPAQPTGRPSSQGDECGAQR